MDKKTVFIKTAKGEREEASLPSDLKRIMLLINGNSRADELAKRAPPSLRDGWMDFLAELVEQGYIRDKSKPFAEPKIVAPKSSLLKMFTPKPPSESPLGELDFSAPAPSAAKPAANPKTDEAARIRAEMENAVLIAKNRASAEAAAKAGAKARQEAESAARAKALVDAEEARKAEYKAKKEAESAARAKAVAEAKAKENAAIKAKKEADARVRAEIEAAARAQQLAEEKAKREAEARAKAEAEARAKAEAEARARAEAEARARAEAEARAKAEAEARARKAAEEKARKAAEAKAKQEAEAARLKAEQAAARIKAEQEAAAKIRAEAEINSAAEALAKQRTKSDSNEIEIDLEGFLGGLQQNAAPSGHYAQQGGGRVAEEKHGGQHAASDTRSGKDIAAEMERLKNEAEIARRKMEEEARRQAEEKALSEEQSRAWEEAEQRAMVQAVVEVEQASKQAALQQAKSTPRIPVARKRREPLPLGKITFVLFALALIVVVVLPYVYPLNEYITPLEQRLSALLKQPVRIEGVSAATFPPTLKLQNVVIGNREEVKAANIKLNFDVFSLFSEIKIISNADLENVSIQGKYFEKQIDSLKLIGGDAEYPVHHLTLQRLRIVTDEIALPVLSGIADLGVQGTIFRVSLHSTDDKFDIDLQSNPEKAWQVSINLRESSLPILPNIVFSDLSAKGNLDNGEVDFTEMDAHIFNGILLGKAKLKWGNVWKLSGSIEAKTIDLDKMFPDFHVEGEMFGDGTFSMSGTDLSSLGKNPYLEGSFTVKAGTVNVDVVETARLLSREHIVGGRTRFDEMIGTVQFGKHTSYFRRLKTASEMLSLNGSFEVSPDNRLSGNLNAEIKMRPGSNQLTLYGTPIEPRLRAGR